MIAVIDKFYETINRIYMLAPARYSRPFRLK